MILARESIEHIKHNYITGCEGQSPEAVFSLILLQKRNQGFEGILIDAADHWLDEQLGSTVCFVLFCFMTVKLSECQ